MFIMSSQYRKKSAAAALSFPPVSYTHLDVYKRQILHTHTRIQARIRILENHLHILPDFMNLFMFIIGNIISIKDDFAVGRLMELQNGSSQCGLAASGLSYNSQSLAFIDGQRNTVHRVKLYTFGYIKICLLYTSRCV